MPRIKKIKVVEIIRQACGGMKEHYVTLLKGLKERGFDVLALCNFSHPVMEELRDAGMTVCPFNIPGEIQPYRDIKRTLDVFSVIKEYRANLVHCHGFKAGVIGRLGAIFAGCPRVYTVHNFILPMTLPVRRWMFGRLEHILCRYTQGIITVSHALKEELIQNCRIPDDKIHVVHNGIPAYKNIRAKDMDFVNDLRRRLNIGRHTTLVGTTARLIPSKGIDYLLDAIPAVIEHINDVHFLIMGNGPYKQELIKKAAYLNIQNKVTFLGYVNNIHNYLNAIDIFVLPSLSEGLGISIIEAMAAGKPVIAARTGGIPEIVNHDDNGYLVTPGDAGELALAIMYLIANPQVREDYGRRGCRDVRERFSVDKMLNLTADILQRYAQR
ncbi:MAG: glycosyltransferase family 4 protein [Caldicoprobacteraceae bacterium]|jgi:glycosyltransferase involved in cell wall biosynthesis